MLTIKEGHLLTNESMGASFESDPLSVLYFRGYSITCTWTGAPAGTLSISVSNDTSDVPDELVNWEPLDDSEVAISAAGQHVYNIRYVYYNKIKIVYTRTSGTGSMSSKYTGKT
jgi:hypothetical protein